MAQNKNANTGDLSALNSKSDITPVQPGELSTGASGGGAAGDFERLLKATKAEFGKLIGEVIQKCRLSAGFPAFSKTDEKRAAAVWLETFALAGIPVDAVAACYRAAKLKRIDLQNETAERLPPISDEFIAAQWKASEREKYFAARARSQIATPRLYGCPDCFGNETGRKYFTNEKGNLVLSNNEFCRHENFNADAE